MKYLLILLFLFSTHSFSGEFDERGLLCKFSLTEKESKNVIMFLVTFNGDKSTYNFLQRNEETGKLESHIQIYKFISNEDFIIFKYTSGDKKLEVNRKSLEFTDYHPLRKPENGICKVHEVGEAAIEYKKYVEEKQKVWEKRFEGNKI